MQIGHKHVAVLHPLVLCHTALQFSRRLRLHDRRSRTGLTSSTERAPENPEQESSDDEGPSATLATPEPGSIHSATGASLTASGKR